MTVRMLPILALAVATACAGTSNRRQDAAPQARQPAEPVSEPDDCTLQVAVHVDDVKDGAAVTITTAPDQVVELRRTVRDAVAKHVKPDSPVQADVQDIEQGTLLTLLTEDPVRVPLLRTIVRTQAERLVPKHCNRILPAGSPASAPSAATPATGVPEGFE